MKAVREWLKHFEEMAEADTVYGLQMKNGLECRFTDYKHIKEVGKKANHGLIILFVILNTKQEIFPTV